MTKNPWNTHPSSSHQEYSGLSDFSVIGNHMTMDFLNYYSELYSYDY
jgi:hypothetical protein